MVLDDCGWRCVVDYELVVPPGIRVEGGIGSGSVTVDGAEAVDVAAGSGSIDISNVAGAVRASTNSGAVPAGSYRIDSRGADDETLRFS